MPEKPEVITVAKSLSNRILNRKIIDVDVFWDNIVVCESIPLFQKKIKNQTIHSITTRGKWLVIELDKDDLLIHLRMEGKFLFRDKNEPRGKHEHVLFTLDNKEQMRFHDTRKFGKIYLISKEMVYKIKPLGELGLEYDDPNLTKEYLYSKLKKKHITIKQTLLDQQIIAGIGNIYDDEILFLSHISPLKKACNVSIEECDFIVKNVVKVLNKAISFGGTTIKSYTSEEGVHGKFQNELLVHGKKFCPNCNSPILKIQLGGRGTYYCERCQK